MKRFLLFFWFVGLCAACGSESGPTCAADAVEDCSNEIDDNCDGAIDCEDDTCAAECGVCVASGDEVCGSGEDEDCDGDVDCADDDCSESCAPPEVYAAPIIISAPPGSTDPVEKVGEIHNLGSTPITIDSITLDGAAAFEISFPETPGATSASDTAPSEIGAQGAILVRVTFTPTESTETAKIVIKSSAPTFEIPVIADSTGPCLDVLTPVSDFGLVAVDQSGYAQVTIENCSEVLGIQISDVSTCHNSGDECDTSDTFEATPPIGPPTLLPRDRRTYVVKFSPDRTGAFTGRITFEADGAMAEASLRGEGIEGDCPTATVVSDEISTTPQTTVTLDGSASEGGANYRWSVIDAPFGANTFIEEGETTDFYADLAGTYVVELRLTNDDDVSSCGERALVKIDAYPTERFYVEAFWDTPRDHDQLDDNGTDLDLHFLHEGGGWDSVPWDVYWRNEAPDWGEPGTDDDPMLSNKDDDGHGPEVVTLDQPESNVVYSIGVYSFDDNDFGGSFATTRIFVSGEEKFQQRRQWLMPGEFWYVAQISYPSNQILIEDRVSVGFPIR